jgi:hypothetical protein
MLDHVIAAQNKFRDHILSASEDDPPTYAALKKLHSAEHFCGDMASALN